MNEADTARAASVRHHLVAMLLALVALSQPAGVLAQRLPDTIAFPGGVTLQWKLDEMTDRKRCSVFTPIQGLYAGIHADDVVSFWIPEKAPLASAQRPALARIDTNPPINLEVSDKPRLITVPKSRGREVVEALYRRSKIIVRYYTFPQQDERNITLTVGDVASAYDFAVKNCGWKSLGMERSPLPKEPHIFKGERGYVSATFGGEAGWNVIFSPEYQSCRLAAGHVHAIFSSRQGQPEQVLSLGTITFYRPSGEVVATLRHDRFAPGPIADFIRAAEDAGEYGWVDMKTAKATSLYGLVEPVAYTEQTCGMRLR